MKILKISVINQVLTYILDNLINIFKSNAISEFMDMKKDLLEERDQIIKKETYRYVNMFELKSNEVLMSYKAINMSGTATSQNHRL